MATLVVPAAISAPIAQAQQSVRSFYTDSAFATVYKELGGCLKDIPANDAQLLTLRFGGGAGSQTATAAAASLHETVGALVAEQFAALRRLEAAYHRGQCTKVAVAVATSTTTSTAASVSSTTTTTTSTTTQTTSAVVAPGAGTGTPPVAGLTPRTAASGGLSWTSPTEIALLVVILAALAALVYGLRRDFGAPRLDRGGPLSRWRRDR